MTGRCHICKTVTEVKYCGVCKHYFCRACRVAYWWRGWGWIKEHLLGQTEPGCCGEVVR